MSIQTTSPDVAHSGVLAAAAVLAVGVLVAGLAGDPVTAQAVIGTSARAQARAIAVPLVKAQMRMSADRAEFFGARMAAHGLDTIEKYFTELRRFNMLRHAPQITCATLIIEAEHDFAGGGGQTLIDALAAPSQLVRLTEHQGADGHCGGLGQEIWSEVVYQWLRNTLPHDLTAVTGTEKPDQVSADVVRPGCRGPS